MTAGPNDEIDRVQAFVDGFNFYHGMMAKDWGRYRWLDYEALIRRRIRGDQVLTALKYFTAPVTHPPEKSKRQADYVRALSEHTMVEVIPGAFEQREVQCRVCSQWYKRPQEKRTDVNIATHLIVGAFDDQYDTAYLVSADADLVPAVAFIKERFGKRFVLIDPPRRHSDELAAIVDHHWHFTESHLRQSQLPDPVEYLNRRRKVRRIYRPGDWS